MTKPWRRCLELAWDSYRAGTTPVGAVVVAPDGTVVAEGRGRRYEPPATDRQLSYTRIAHAELNALALLPPTRGYGDHTLLTTLEPCCMCLGAIVQAAVVSVHYAAPDPYAGTARVVLDVPQARRRPPVLTGPLTDERGRFAELLHLAWLIEADAPDYVLAPHRAERPAAYAAATRLRLDGVDSLDDAMAAAAVPGPGRS